VRPSLVELLDTLGSLDESQSDRESLGAVRLRALYSTGLPNPTRNSTNMVLARKWPQRWLDYYIKKITLRRSGAAVPEQRQPVEWSEAPSTGGPSCARST
jgi:hypothetical protein